MSGNINTNDQGTAEYCERVGCLTQKVPPAHARVDVHTTWCLLILIKL